MWRGDPLHCSPRGCLNHLNRGFIFRYDVTVLAKDHGSPEALSGETSLLVRVLDENDDVPTFPSDQLVIPLSEGTKIGTHVHIFKVSPRRHFDLKSIETFWMTLGHGSRRRGQRAAEIFPRRRGSPQYFSPGFYHRFVHAHRTLGQGSEVGDFKLASTFILDIDSTPTTRPDFFILRDVVKLTVTATDGGSPQLTGTVSVIVNVQVDFLLLFNT